MAKKTMKKKSKPVKKTPKAGGASRATGKSAKKKTVSKPSVKVAKKDTTKRTPKGSAKATLPKKAKTVEKKPAAKKASKTTAPSPAAAAPPRRTKRQLEPFRRLLVEKHTSLLQAYTNSKGSTRENTSDGTEDYIDYAVSSYDRDFTLSLTEMERKQIRLVEEALRRIERREYGRCMQCGQEIPEKRLLVEPWARHCIRCQELEEQGLLQQQGFDRDYDDDEELDDEVVVDTEEDAEPPVEDEESPDSDDDTDDDADDDELKV